MCGSTSPASPFAFPIPCSKFHISCTFLNGRSGLLKNFAKLFYESYSGQAWLWLLLMLDLIYLLDISIFRPFSPKHRGVVKTRTWEAGKFRVVTENAIDLIS